MNETMKRGDLRNYHCLIALLAIGITVFAGCKSGAHCDKPSAGNANLSRVIAVGSSFTAGYMDGGLYRQGQLNSYPGIIARQMQKAGGGLFLQPLFTSQQANGSGYLKLTGYNEDGTPQLDRVKTNLAIRGYVSASCFGELRLFTKYTGPINNYGVPGIKLKEITYRPYGNVNGFFERLLTGNAPDNMTSYLDLITTKPFTFFTNWLGTNDVLPYAKSGGAADQLTDQGVFEQLYKLSISKLTAEGQQGAVATIPDFTTFPFFNTITVRAVLARAQKADPKVKALYITAKDSGENYSSRPATPKDLIILDFNTQEIGKPMFTEHGTFPYGLSVYTPIEHEYVLDENEVLNCQNYIRSYNNSIRTIAEAKGLAVFDAYSFFNKVMVKGLRVSGLKLNLKLIKGGLFSLDRVNFNNRGYAVVANEFIKAINRQYEACIPTVNIASY
jgi:hypothetical protein